MSSLVILPTYNEIHNLGRIVPQLIGIGLDLSVLIIDDNSPDGTGRCADDLAAKHSNVAVIHRPSKLGLGTAYLEGFRFALEHNFEIIFTMDSDFSHDPAYLPEFTKKLENCDLVVGSRYVKNGGVKNWGILRKTISRVGNIYARTLLNIRMDDCTSGFMGFHSKIIKNMDLAAIKSEGYAFLIEFKYKALNNNFNVMQHPIIFTDRTAGKSKISNNIILEAALLVWKLKIRR